MLHLGLTPIQEGCESDAEAIGIRDREVAQPVVSVPNRDHDPGPDIACHLPAVVDVRNHDPDVGDRKLGRLHELRGFNALEGCGLREKETMVFPGKFDEVAGVPEEFEAQRAIERDRPLGVANDDLGNELFGGVDVWAFGSGHLNHGSSPSSERVASEAEFIEVRREEKAAAAEAKAARSPGT